MKKIASILPAAALLFGIAAFASAHAVVSPKQANVAQFTDFSLGVPSEKPVATTAVRLLIPDGLNFVTPYVKPGWKIAVKTAPASGNAAASDGDMQTTKITEIDWTGGTIPAGQKDAFMFSAQVPAQAATLAWKAYQTYQDGSVVSWDQAPGAKADGKTGPYSTTMVINDLGTGNQNPAPAQANKNTIAEIALILSIAALAAAARAVFTKKF